MTARPTRPHLPQGRRLRVCVAAGGTGGHIRPGQALVTWLQDHHACEVQWVGTDRPMDRRLLMPDVTACLLRFRSWRRQGWWQRCWMPFQLLHALWTLERFWWKHGRPDVVVAMGGYPCLPAGLLARWHTMPLVLHEQNRRLGRTLALLRRWAVERTSAFEGVFPASDRPHAVGFPLPPDWTPPAYQEVVQVKRPLHCLVLGGSQGAQAINQVVVDAIALADDVIVWHQTGEPHHADVQAAYATQGLTVRCDAFVDRMEEAYRWADVVVARAGAGTVCECQAFRKPCLLIPYPHAVDDHQTANAEVVVAQGLATLCPASTWGVEALLAWWQGCAEISWKFELMGPDHWQAAAALGAVVIQAARAAPCGRDGYSATT